ncbi:MAG: DUF1566 domain-containing protein [Treponema sp.]|jgi:hypothetical protein|nr:DUF1566 domain-containing protein [Treponema sp.]
MKKVHKDRGYISLFLGMGVLITLLSAACPLEETSEVEEAFELPLSKTSWVTGDKGPGGGIIFYEDPDGFQINGVTYHYLEAAPQDVSKAAPWGLNGTNTRHTLMTVGQGMVNTAMLVDEFNIETISAAKLCDDYRGGGKSDWYLPSYKELDFMYKNLHKNNMGNFSGGYYWSSSEYGHNTARAQNFMDGFQEQAYLKTSLNCVRPIRAFSRAVIAPAPAPKHPE